MFFVFGFGMGNVIAPASVVMQNALPLARAGAGSAVQGIPSPPAAPGDSGYRTDALGRSAACDPGEHAAGADAKEGSHRDEVSQAGTSGCGVAPHTTPGDPGRIVCDRLVMRGGRCPVSASGGVGRDRDESGRPFNARPRDGLGRPLPHGAEGVERVPEGLSLPPRESLTEAQRLIDEGRPFHAHEVLEGTWKAAPPSERDLWQGLAQLAVGLTHAMRGNSTGAVAVLTRGRNKISAYADAPPYGIDIVGLTAWSNGLIEQLATHKTGQSDPFAQPNLRLS